VTEVRKWTTPPLGYLRVEQLLAL